MVTPGPSAYKTETSLGRPRSSSTERNAPRATIGLAPRSTKLDLSGPTPGPNKYKTEHTRNRIGGESSAKVCFSTAVRPISAKPGEIRTLTGGPGPQQYGTVSTDKYMKRKFVIPSMSFATAARDRSRS